MNNFVALKWFVFQNLFHLSVALAQPDNAQTVFLEDGTEMMVLTPIMKHLGIKADSSVSEKEVTEIVRQTAIAMQNLIEKIEGE